MEITQARAWYNPLRGTRTSVHLDAETVAAIKEKRSTDVPAIGLYDRAMASRNAVANIEASVKALDGTLADRHGAEPDNVVVLLNAAMPAGQTATGNAAFCPTTDMAILQGDINYGTRFYIAPAQDGGKDIGQVYKYVDYQRNIHETVMHADGAITWTSGTLSKSEYKALPGKFKTG